MLKPLFKLAFFSLLTITAIFTSCNADDNLVEETTEEYVDQALFTLQESGNIGRLGCFELVFPITVEFADGSSTTAESYEDLIEAFHEWKENNPGPSNRPTFVFPIEVISEDGELISVNDQTELRELKQECPGNFHGKGFKGHRGKCSPCFKIVFPIEILFPDGTTAEAIDRQSLKMLIRTWKQENPNSDQRPEIIFPIEVEMEEDGTIITVNNIEELKELRQSCMDEG